MGFKKLLVLAMVLIFVSGIFGGCSAKNGNGTAASNGSSDAVKSAGSADARGLEGNLYVTGLPIVKEKETIKVMVPGFTEPNEMEFYKRMEEETNVRVEWEIFEYAQVKEKKNLMFASGDYPDAVGGWFLDDNDVMTYGPQGILVPIDGLIEKYAPNFSAFLNQVPDAKKVLTTPDKHIYTLPIYAEQPKTKDCAFINKTWLDKLGLQIPTTTEEFYTVLKAFKERDPNGNNKKDEIPFSFHYKDGNAGHYSFFGSFGIIDRTNHIGMKNGKVIYTAVQPEFKDAIIWFNKLYEEGLIDPEVFTHDTKQYRAKATQDPEILGVFTDWDSYNIAGQERSEKDYVALPPLKGPTGIQLWQEGDPSIFKNQFAITNAAKKPELILRWIDQNFDPETSVEVCKGPFDVTIEKTADGKIIFKTPPEGISYGEFRRNKSISSFPYAILPDMMDRIEKNANEVYKDKLDKIYEPYVCKETYPIVWFKPEEQQELQTINTDILKYVDEKVAKWIIGESSVNVDWDSYLNELKKMKLDRMIEIYQTAANR